MILMRGIDITRGIGRGCVESRACFGPWNPGIPGPKTGQFCLDSRGGFFSVKRHVYLYKDAVLRQKIRLSWLTPLESIIGAEETVVFMKNVQQNSANCNYYQPGIAFWTSRKHLYFQKMVRL